MKAYCRDLGRMDYKTCWDLQQELFDAGVARKRTGPIPVPGADGADDAGTVLLVEHPPVYTLGKSGHAIRSSTWSVSASACGSISKRWRRP